MMALDGLPTSALQSDIESRSDTRVAKMSFAKIFSWIAIAASVVLGAAPAQAQPKPKPAPQPTHRAGAARGFNRARGLATGIAGRAGASVAVSTCTGSATGLRWPDEREIAQRKRRRDEAELLLLEF